MIEDRLLSHNRHSSRYDGYDYSQPGAYFVTLVTRERKCIFGEIFNGEVHLFDLGKIARLCWQEMQNHHPNIQIEPFVIMPNHIHGVVTLCEIDGRG